MPLSEPGQTSEPSVSVPSRRGGEAGRHRRAAARARAAGAAVQHIGVRHQPADPRPAADRMRRADVRPFAQIRLAQDDRRPPRAAARPPARRDGVTLSASASEPAVVGIGSAVSILSFTRIGMPCSGPRGPLALRSASSARASSMASGLTAMHAVQRGPAAVDLVDARQICTHQLFRRHPPRREIGLRAWRCPSRRRRRPGRRSKPARRQTLKQ